MAKGAVRSVNIYVNNKEAIRSMDELKKRIEAETRAWQKMAKGTSEYYAKAAEISRMQDALNKENELIKSTTERRQKSLIQIGMIGSAMTGLVQTVQMLHQGLQKVRDLAADMAGLDDAMGRVRKTTNLTRQEVQELNKEFTKIDTRTSREELNELAYAAGKLGVNGKEDVLEFVRAADVINVALGDVLGGTDAIIEVTKLAQVFKNTTKEIENAGLEETLIRTGSVINELGKTSTANEGQIEKFLMRIASYASIAGMSLDQMAGLGSVLSQNSKAPEMSATAVTKIMQQMIKKTGSFAEMIGMGEKELSDLMAKDFNQAFLAVLQKLHDIGDVQTIVPIFKDLGADATRASQVILALSTNIDRVREAQETANKAIKEGTSMNKEYSVMNETMQAQMEKAKKTVFDARVELGEKLYPYIIKYTFFGGKVIKWLSKLTKHGENAFMALAAAAAIAANKIMKNWSGLKDKIGQLTPVMEWNEMKEAQKRYKAAEEEIAMIRRRQADLQKQVERSKQREAAMQENLNNLEAQRESISKGRDARTKAEYAINKEIEISKKVSLGLEKEMSASVARTTTLKKSLQDSENRILALKMQGKASEAEMNWELQNKARIENAIAVEEKKQLLIDAQITKEKTLQKSLEAQKNVLASTTLTKEEKIAQINSIIAQQEKDILRTKEIEAGVRAQINALMQREVVLEKEMGALKEKTKFTALLKNHWMLILTILIEVGLQIAKIVKKHREMAEEAKKVRENIEKEKHEALMLFNALKNANLEERERYKIMGEINSRYGDYLKNLRNEKGELISLEAAYKAVTRAIINQHNAKGYKEAFDKMMDEMAPQLESSTKMIREIINKMITGDSGTSNSLADEIYSRIIDEMSNAGEKDASKILNEISKRYAQSDNLAGIYMRGYTSMMDFTGSKTQDITYGEELLYLLNSYLTTTQKIDKQNKDLMTLYSQNTKTLNERLDQLKRDYNEAEDEATRLDKIAEAHSLYAEYFLPEGWENYAKSDLEALVKSYNAQIKNAEKAQSTFWGVVKEEGLKAIAAINNKMKEGGGGYAASESDTDDYDPEHPVTSGKKSGKTPEERWADLMRKSAKLNEKAVVESLGISSAKESVIKTYDAILKEVETFNSTYRGFEERAAAETARLEKEKWDEIARIEEEEHRKRIQKIDENLASVDEKLSRFQLKQRRKHQAQLATDLEEVENDWAKLLKKTEEERDKLLERRDAADIVSKMFDTSDSEAAADILNQYKDLLSKFGITAESWKNALSQNPASAQNLLTLLGLDFSKEDERTLDAIIQKIKDLDAAKIKEIQSLASERAREIVTELSDTATRQYQEALKTIEEQIKTLEVAMNILKENNENGDNDERIKEIEKTLAFLKGQKSDIQDKYDKSFGKDTWATLFGITEQDWAAWGQNWEDNLANMTDRLSTFADNVFDLWSSIDSVMQNQADAEMQRYEELYDSKSAALKKQLDSGIISQKRYDAQMEQMQKEKEKKEKKLKHEAFERERVANLIQGAINLALTISSIYAKEPGGLVVKSAAAAVAAAIQAAQLAVIASEPNPYAKGGYIERKQYAVMGEQGPEWVASNKLLKDEKTKDIVAALDEYQQGNTRALDKLIMPAPDLKSVSQAVPEKGRNFAAPTQTNNYYYQNEDDGEVLQELKKLNGYLTDPMNRRSYISRDIQLEFDEQEREVREMARL
ncbi:MAG: phage tail tape measure protein [Bacteroidales bacterium]|nr:phage tail tape measure protein [Bacteroidales bacterium]